MFSRINDVFAFGPLSALFKHKAFDKPVCPPTKLVRCSNESYDYFGQYPRTCAFISTNSIVEDMIGKSALTVKRHVAEIAVDMTIAKQDVVRRINQLLSQLESLSDICEWKKNMNEITVTFAELGEGERVKFEFFVCNDTGMMHLLVGKECFWNHTGPVYPDMNSDKLNKLIYAIRRVYQDTDNYVALPDLTEEMWESTYPLTREKTTEFVEFTPEWLHNGAEWNFPDIEGDNAVLSLGDILERMASARERDLGPVFTEISETESTNTELSESERAEPDVFEVEECEEPPYKKRKLV